MDDPRPRVEPDLEAQLGRLGDQAAAERDRAVEERDQILDEALAAMGMTVVADAGG